MALGNYYFPTPRITKVIKLFLTNVGNYSVYVQAGKYPVSSLDAYLIKRNKVYATGQKSLYYIG